MAKHLRRVIKGAFRLAPRATFEEQLPVCASSHPQQEIMPENFSKRTWTKPWHNFCIFNHSILLERECRLSNLELNCRLTLKRRFQ